MSDNISVAYGNGSTEPLNVPRLAAGTFTVQGTGTEVLLVLQNASPLIDRSTNCFVDRSVMEPVALVSISPGTAKDLCILLAQVVENHERAFGPITTPFTAQRDREKLTAAPVAQFSRA